MPKHRQQKPNAKKSYSFLNKDVLFLVGMGIVFMAMIAGTSYAILKMTVWGEKKNEVIAGTLSIEYKDGKTINLDNTYPMTDNRGMTTPSYQFSVENTGDIDTKYEILLEEATKNQNTLDISYLRYSIKKGDEDWSAPKDLDSLILENEVELKVGEKKDYQLRIWIKESAGNETQGKEFKARIVVNAIQETEPLDDVVAPIINLAGNLSVNVEENTDYNDLGVESVIDNKDVLDKNKVSLSYEYYNGETYQKVDEINTRIIGVYYIYYKISDESGNEGVAVRSVNVYHKDTNPPVITLKGESLTAVEKDTEYIDAGVEAIDQEEENISDRIVTVGTVNTKKIGTYTIKYLITDQSGNTASVVRVVNVIKTISVVEDELTLDLTNDRVEQLTVVGENLGELSFESEDEHIVYVDENGLLTARGVGRTNVLIKGTSGYHKEVTVTVQETININYVKQGLGVSAIGKETDTCIMTTENGCDIVAPSITVMDGYTAVGWSSEQDAKDGTAVGKNITVKESGNYYAISYKNEITYTVNFNANGNTIDAESKTCKRDKAYNNHLQAENCTIITPTITAPKVTPIIIGYNQTSTAEEKEIGSAEELTVDDSVNGRTYYAITKSEQITRSLVFKANGNKIDNGTIDISKTCLIDATYNGKEQKETCEITTPTITASNNNTPNIVGYNEDSAGTTAQLNSAAKTDITKEIDKKTYYAITTNAQIKRTITFNPNGNPSFTYAGAKQTQTKTYDLCTIGPSYNGKEQSQSCTATITMASIEAPNATPTIVGWSTGTTVRVASYTSAQANAVVTASADVTYYAQTKKDAQKVTITFDKNGAQSQTDSTGTAKTDATVTRECTRSEVWNNAVQGNCTVKSPVIVGTTNTPTVVGYSAAATTHSNGWTHNTDKEVSANATWYAQTKKDAQKVTITFNKNGAQSQTDSTGAAKTDNTVTRECTRSEVWNNAVQGNCTVKSPVIVGTTNTPTVVGYSAAAGTHSNGWTHNTDKEVNADATWYAQTKKDAQKVTITFNKNGAQSQTDSTGAAKTDNTVTRECSRTEVWNNAVQANCTVKSPTIVGTTNTPTVVGYSAAAGTHSNGWTHNTDKEVSADATWYAQTKKDAQKVTITFDKNGAQSQTDSSGNAKTDTTVTRECTRAEAWNNAVQGNCTVKSPVIVGTTNTPTVVGYSVAAATHSNGWTHNTDKEVNANATWYAQTKKDAQKVTITFNKNGAQSQTDSSGNAKTDTTVTRECTRSEVWNNATQGNCTVKSPVIVGTTNTPNILGYSTGANTHSNGWTHNTDKEVSANATWYAQTYSSSFSRSVNYSKGSGVSSIGKNSDSCTVDSSYNGASQGSSCTVSLPSITSKTGYNTGFWSTSSTASSGSAAGASITLSSATAPTYYAIAKDTTKPIWQLSSASSSTGAKTIYAGDTLTIVIKGTDTSGSVTSTLAAGNITVKAGTSSVTPSLKTLSSASNITNGKQYTLTLSGINTDGAISIVIAKDTIKDGDGNGNVETTISSGYTVSSPAFYSTVFNSSNIGSGGSLNTSDSEQTFITGSNPNNYVWYSGKLWRAVAKDTSDNSVKLVTQYNMSSIYFGNNTSTFSGSYMQTWLNDTSEDGFLKNLRSTSTFLKSSSKWNATLDANGETMTNVTKPAKTTMVTTTVGLLNLYEFKKSYTGIAYKNGYLSTGFFATTITPINQWSVATLGADGGIFRGDSNASYGVRPAVNILSSVKVSSGKGTKTNPYRLKGDDDKYLVGTLLTTRYSGEYVRFGSGKNNLYRILSHEAGKTKIVLDGYVKNSSGSVLSKQFSTSTSLTSYSPNNSSYPQAYFLNHDFINSSNGYFTSTQLNLIDSGTWYLGNVTKLQNYNLTKCTSASMNCTKNATSVSAKIGLPRFGEILQGPFEDRYVGSSDNPANQQTWLVTPKKSARINGNVDEIDTTTSMAMRPALFLKTTAKITGGTGTKTDPFTIS